MTAVRVDECSDTQPDEVASAPANLLGRFLALETAQDVAFHAFSREWGPIGFCAHGLPRAHGLDVQARMLGTGGGRVAVCPLRVLRVESKKGDGIGFSYIRQETFHESVGDWRALASRGRALLEVANAVNGGGIGSTEAWALVSPRVNVPAEIEATAADPTFRSSGWSVGRLARWKLGKAATQWLLEGDVRPQVTGFGERPTFVLGPGPGMQPVGGLYAALAVQLVAAVAEEGTTLCTSCGVCFTFKGPRSGVGRYCPACGRKAANRDAQAAFRERQKEEKGRPAKHKAV